MTIIEYFCLCLKLIKFNKKKFLKIVWNIFLAPLSTIYMLSLVKKGLSARDTGGLIIVIIMIIINTLFIKKKNVQSAVHRFKKKNKNKQQFKHNRSCV